ncbi:MAG: phosphodiester glycosidase family protein [Anaerolineae bacterium]|nr:phosphodiester glycosidase family protein [Anaerolineae bacterium]
MIDVIVRTLTAKILLPLVVVGCGIVPSAEPTTQPTEAPTNGWTSIASGVEQRTYIPQDNVLAQLITIRLDPDGVMFRVHYRPESPLTLQGWRSELVDADVIINANFFTPENVATGMIVADGVVYGQSFTDRGGTFGILDDLPVIRSNIRQPYTGEPYSQAIQAFPMLVTDSEASYFNARATDRSRRSVIGMDATGRIVLMATPGLGLSLNDLSAYLPSTDLNLIQAFNLDGGRSTMLFVNQTNTILPSFDPVPAVLAVYMRDNP